MTEIFRYCKNYKQLKQYYYDNTNINFNIFNKHTWSPLMLACRINNYKCAELILNKAKANIDLQNKYGENVLMKVVRKNQVTCLELLLKYNPNIYLENKYGENVLMMASSKGHEKCLLLLLKYESNLNIILRYYHEPELHFLASKNGNYQCVSLLLKYGSENSNNLLLKYINVILIKLMQNEYSLSFSKNKLKCIKLLLAHIYDYALHLQPEYDVNFEHMDYHEILAPIILASSKGYYEIVKILLKYGANVNITDNNNNTALMIACLKVNIKNYIYNRYKKHYVCVLDKLIKLLLEHSNININLKNNDGYTALHIICRDNNIDILKLFLN